MKETQKKISHSSNTVNQAKLQILGDSIMDNFDAIINHFELELRDTNRMYVGRCPIHGGDRKDAFNIFHHGDTIRGNWYCRTKGCEKIFIGSPIGLIRGLLSRFNYKWEDRGDATATFKEATDWCLSFLNKDFDNIEVNKENIEQQQFVMLSKIHSYKRPINKYNITRDKIRNSLNMPAQYFIDRGFSDKILDDYDVGVCLDPTKRMYSRAVVPIYDDDGRYMVGCTGRSIYEKCSKCGGYHNPKHPCPREEDVWKYSKWKHSPDFKAEEYLYNFWKARYHIEATNVAILVESPGNCWRAIESGYSNVVGIFGSKLSYGQRILLDSSGAMILIVLTDGDDAGILAKDNIVQQCKDTYTVVAPKIPTGKDLADLSVSEVQSIIEPIMKQYSTKR